MLTAQYTASNMEAMMAFGTALSPHLRACDVVALRGDLGAGKTTLARGLIRAYCEVNEVSSPTFPIVQCYDGPRGRLWHFDAYRLEDPVEIWEIGLEDALTDGVSVIEWPERLGDIIPEERLDVSIKIVGSARVITIVATKEWSSRWQLLARMPGIGVSGDL